MAELTDEETAAVVDRSPFDQRLIWNQKALQKALLEWKETREDEFELLWESDEFDWMIVGWQTRHGHLGTHGTNEEYTFEPDVSDQYLDDEQLEELAYEFAETWITCLQDTVREHQQQTALSPKEFVTLVIMENPSCGEAHVADALGVSTGTVRGKLGRVREKLDEADATAELAEIFDEERMREKRDRVQSSSYEVEDVLTADEFPVESKPRVDF